MKAFSTITAASAQLDQQETFHFLAAGGEMGERIRSFDWSKTPLGPIEQWLQSLTTTVQLMFGSRY